MFVCEHGCVCVRASGMCICVQCQSETEASSSLLLAALSLISSLHKQTR